MKYKSTLNHIAIIMDGNGRWAVSQGLDRIDGHREGVNVVKNIIRYLRLKLFLQCLGQLGHLIFPFY